MAGRRLAGVAEPSRERRRHDRVVRDDRPLADASGGVGRPYRVVDTLALMEKRGSITRPMRLAGEAFRDEFALAALDALKAADLARVGGSGVAPGASLGERAETARGRVWQAIRRVGGVSSPAGSCLWHVLGLGQSLGEWAQNQGWAGRCLSREAAGGILVAALGTLVKRDA